MSRPRLDVSLDVPLPRELAVGRGSAVFVAGTCFCPSASIASLELTVDGESRPLLAYGMPRLDFFAALHPDRDPYQAAGLPRDPGSAEDPLLHAYASGFWGLATLDPGEPAAAYALGLRARLEDGDHAQVDVERIDALAPPPSPASPPWPQPGAQPPVAVCMATYDPPIELFRRQIQSIRDQSHRNWLCFISDDCSRAEAFAALRRELDGDPRFVLDRSPRRRGFFENFERALAMAPADAQFVALADQDDYWYPDKLATLLSQIGTAQLVYSDARVVARSGSVISETYWRDRGNNHSDLLSLLVANSVTGAASLLRREVLDYALPFPPAQFAHFHDHWLALTALSLGDIAYVERPLYDYVQHGGASLGHATANRMTGLLDRLREQRPARERVRAWRLNYFVDACRLIQVATILLMRCGPRMSARKRRALERYLRADSSSPALAVLAARGIRELVGRPETLGAEWMLAHAFLWRRLLAATARQLPQRRLRLDAVPPPSLVLKPARVATGGPARELADKIAPLELALSDSAPERVNLLIPTIDLQHFFGGYITKLNLAKRLAARGLRVRVLTVDPVGPLPPNWKAGIESYRGLAGLFDSVEVEFGRGPAPVEMSPSDRLIATTWWTAHIAAAALRSLIRDRFVYLIQEYEPFTFPMGAYAALAAGSYELPHFALFSSELLRDYFRAHRIGVYASGAEVGDRRSLAFENAITAVRAPTAAELTARGTPARLLFYARPEAHAARNMYELGLLGLSGALEAGALSGWELDGIGTVRGGRAVQLAAGSTLNLLPRSGQGEYAELIRRYDVGLALMYTPHPSLVPLEMAAGGLVTVTNTFENKTAEAMAALSSNILAVEPTIEAVADGVIAAAAAAADYEGRIRGSDVSWSRDWAQTFDERLLDWVADALG